MARLCIRLLFLLAGWGQSPVRTPWSCRYVSKVLDLGSLFTPRVPFNCCDKPLIGERKEEKVNTARYWWYFSECLSVCLSPRGRSASPRTHNASHISRAQIQSAHFTLPLTFQDHKKIREETNPAKWIKMKITLAGIHPNSSTLNQGPVSHRPIEVRFFLVYFFIRLEKKRAGEDKKKKIALLPSKQALRAQAADDKTRSGNNYHPLRLDSHICMPLESIHERKINYNGGEERDREKKSPSLLYLCTVGSAALTFIWAGEHRGEMESSSASL